MAIDTIMYMCMYTLHTCNHFTCPSLACLLIMNGHLLGQEDHCCLGEKYICRLNNFCWLGEELQNNFLELWITFGCEILHTVVAITTCFLLLCLHILSLFWETFHIICKGWTEKHKIITTLPLMVLYTSM